MHHGILVPGIGQQARGERGGQQAAVDHAEEASPHLCGGCRTAEPRELVKDGFSLTRSLGQRAVQPGERSLCRSIRGDGPVADPAQVGLPVLDGAGEQAAVLHLLVHGLVQRALIQRVPGRWGRGLVGHGPIRCGSPSGRSGGRG